MINSIESCRVVNENDDWKSIMYDVLRIRVSWYEQRLLETELFGLIDEQGVTIAKEKLGKEGKLDRDTRFRDFIFKKNLN